MKLSRKLFISPPAVFFVLVLALAAFAPNAPAADVTVVANPKVADSSLTSDQLKAIFLGQMSQWPSGAKVEFVTLKSGSDVHEDFLKKFVGRSSAQFGNYWKQQVFTGKGRMPRQFDSEAKLIDYVCANEGAVGYISSGMSRGCAKTISIK